MKICRTCNKELEESQFYKTKNKSYSDSLLNSCKICIKEYRKERRVLAVKPEFKIKKENIVYIFD